MSLSRNVSKLLISFIFTIFILVPIGQAQNFKNYTAPDSIFLNGVTLLKKHEQQNAEGFIAEYIPEGQSLDSWTTLFAVRFFWGPSYSPYDSVIAASRNVIDEKRKGDEMANYRRIEDPKAGLFGIDFFISGNYDGKPTAYEHNVFRYVKIPDGMISYQLARRIYLGKSNNQAIDSFISEIPKVGAQMWNELQRTDLPKP
jgi:hypothetical protein